LTPAPRSPASGPYRHSWSPGNSLCGCFTGRHLAHVTALDPSSTRHSRTPSGHCVAHPCISDAGSELQNADRWVAPAKSVIYPASSTANEVETNQAKVGPIKRGLR
jgi:hypothetical protein